MFACVDAPLKNLCFASLRVTETRLIASWVKYRLLAYVQFSDLHSFKSISPALTFLLLPIGCQILLLINRFNRKKFKYFASVGCHLSNALSRVSNRVNPWTRLTDFLYLSLCPSKLLYRLSPISFPPKIKFLILNICPMYQMYNFDTYWNYTLNHNNVTNLIHFHKHFIVS
jgi:hypothetical protein